MSGIELSALSTEVGLALLVLPVVLALAALAGLIWTGSRSSTVEDRLRAYVGEPAGPADAGQSPRAAGAGLTRSGLLDRLGRAFAGRSIRELDNRLAMAGRPGGFSAQAFIGLKVLIALLSAALGIALALAMAGGAATVLLGAAVTLLGFRLPNIWLLRRISARQNEIRTSLPDALDLITVSAEAGLAFEAALARLSTRMTGALAEEFELMLREIGLGKTRRQALRDLAERSDVDELRTFVAMIVQTDELGGDIGGVLRAQALASRTRRRQAAQKKALQAPVKMVFPLVLFILPATFVVILGPAALQILPMVLGG
jgi:tight adherence protein C